MVVCVRSEIEVRENLIDGNEVNAPAVELYCSYNVGGFLLRRFYSL